MNGYKMLADSYRKLLERKGNSEEIERKIVIYDFLSTLDNADMCYLFDSSAFNDITKAYCEKAMQNSGIDKDTIKKVLNNLNELFSNSSAEDITKER